MIAHIPPFTFHATPPRPPPKGVAKAAEHRSNHTHRKLDAASQCGAASSRAGADVYARRLRTVFIFILRGYLEIVKGFRVVFNCLCPSADDVRMSDERKFCRAVPRRRGCWTHCRKKQYLRNLKKHFGEECNKGLTDYLWCNV